MACPMLVSDFCTPRLLWYQTDVKIIIRILLVDAHNYYLRVEDDHLFFSTITNDNRYYLILKLFGCVVAEKTMHTNLGREIKIYLTKGLKWFPWRRLISFKEKDPFITYDVDHICEENYNKKIFTSGEIVKEYKRRNNIQYIMPVVPSSDEEGSDEDVDLWDLGYT